jgi:6-phosphogluconolactonase
MKFITSFLFLMISMHAMAQNKTYMLVGTYTSGKSVGIYVYEFNTNTGAIRLVDSSATSNPSYLAVSPDQRIVYAVNEDATPGLGGKVSSFQFNKKNGHLTLVNQVRSMGDHPCYVAVDKTGKWVAVGNYSSGSLAVFPAARNGSLGSPVSTVHHSGSGPNKDRQEKAHVHSTVFTPDNKYLVVSDLGTDKVTLYPFSQSRGTLDSARKFVIDLPGGSGPRHFIFHPNGKWGYLVQELSGNVTLFDYAKGKLKERQTISSLPAGFNKSFTSADIHISSDGQYLYTSTRDKANTIAIFKINAKTGQLRLISQQETLGNMPRNFNLDPSGNFLLVANQNSDNIVIFRRNPKTGLLRDTGHRVQVGNPVCIKWVQ